MNRLPDKKGAEGGIPATRIVARRGGTTPGGDKEEDEAEAGAGHGEIDVPTRMAPKEARPASIMDGETFRTSNPHREAE